MKKLPRVVIIGFPNVGKSTLFNRLLKEKKALVHSLPGMTRDSVSGVCRAGEKAFVLVDTGGFFGTGEEPISTRVRDKAWEEARNADLILFMADARRDLLPAEEELFVELKKLDKLVLLVVNKVDSESVEEKMADFTKLGEERVFPISAEHKINMETLTDGILRFLPSSSTAADDIKPLKIAIVGRINVGKSSLINRLCGEEKLIVSEIPGTTRDSTDTLIRRNGKAFCLVDTAGIRKLGRARDKREKAGIIRARKNIEQADVVCLVLDAREFPTRQDAAIAHLAESSGKPLLIVLNKWDLLQKGEASSEEARRRIYRKMVFVGYAPCLTISAVTGRRVVKILDLAGEVHQNSLKRIETSRLNDFLAWIKEIHSPRSKDGKPVNLKYMVQKGTHPPSFILFTRSRVSLSPAYEKFFLKLLRERFDFRGTPVRLSLRKT